VVVTDEAGQRARYLCALALKEGNTANVARILQELQDLFESGVQEYESSKPSSQNVTAGSFYERSIYRTNDINR
jgi:hypothetical protein